MPHATLCFYAELNDFLPPGARYQPMLRSYSPRTSVKDVIEGAGIPHTEVDLILVNSQSVDFAYLVEDGDRISVYSSPAPDADIQRARGALAVPSLAGPKSKRRRASVINANTSVV